MTWNDILIDVVNLAFKVITMIAIPYFAAKIGEKIKNDRVAALVRKGEEFVIKSVDMVQQTFVDNLKKQNGFNADAQREAFRMAYENWMHMANDEIKQVISEQVGDLDIWLNTMIEAQVAEGKL